MARPPSPVFLCAAREQDGQLIALSFYISMDELTHQLFQVHSGFRISYLISRLERLSTAAGG